MAKEIVLFKSEEGMDLHSVSAFMHQLADRLALNKVILGRGVDAGLTTLAVPIGAATVVMLVYRGITF